MELKAKLAADRDQARLDRDNFKRDTLQLVLAAIQQTEVDEQKSMNEEEVQALVAKQAKQRRESIADAEKAGRQDLAESEGRELAIIEAYLPQMMSEDEVRRIASEVIAEVGATSPKEMGSVMAQLMPKLQGQADGRVVSSVVRQLLQG
jgi:uncharacterized protein YqeY